jgi:hypothetical protein
MMKTARNLDIAIVVSGDGDFAPAIRAVQEMGVRCEVISFRGNTSSDLIEVADLFTDITQLARVEKGSRSGRRVADDDADLSMTEVPDKQTEGTGLGRGGRGRGGRGRGRAGEAEPVTASASASRTRGGRGRGSAPSTNGVASGRDGDAGLVALPGERLSKAVGNLTESDLAAAEVFTLDDAGESIVEPVSGAVGEVDLEGTELREDDAGRRRRRRGGRGRGRGRGRDEAAQGAEAPSVPDRQAGPAPAPADDFDEDVDEEPVAPRGPRTTPFGSVWDSQLGTSAAPTAANLTPLNDDDEDFDEPEIPEYLIAEQRRGRPGGARGVQGGRGGPRGGRAAYQSAVERERYGRGGGGGINRYPDVSGRTAGNGAPARGPREERGFRRDERPREATPRPTSSREPWSEVPPELEAVLRAQVGQKLSSATEPARPTEDSAPGAMSAAAESIEAGSAVTSKPRAARKTTSSKASKAPASSTAGGAATADAAAPKRRSTRKPDVAESAAPKRRTTRKSTAASGDTASAGDTGSEKPAAKRKSTRKTADTSTEPA